LTIYFWDTTLVYYDLKLYHERGARIRMNRFFQIIFLLLFVFYSFNIFAAENQLPEIPRFDIKDYRVEGNTKLSQKEIEATLARFTGTKKDFGTVLEAQESLELLYQKRGYTTTKVILPAQELKNGIILLSSLKH